MVWTHTILNNEGMICSSPNTTKEAATITHKGTTLTPANIVAEWLEANIMDHNHLTLLAQDWILKTSIQLEVADLSCHKNVLTLMTLMLEVQFLAPSLIGQDSLIMVDHQSLIQGTQLLQQEKMTKYLNSQQSLVLNYCLMLIRWIISDIYIKI